MADVGGRSLRDLLEEAEKLQAQAEEQLRKSEQRKKEHDLEMARIYRDKIRADQDSAQPKQANVSNAESHGSEHKEKAKNDSKLQPHLEDEVSTQNALNAVKLRREEVYLENQQQNLALRKSIAKVAVGAVGLQMFLTNVTFIGYMNAVDYQPEPVVMISWMASTVVQIVGIAMVVTRNLFPSRNGDSKKDEESDL